MSRAVSNSRFLSRVGRLTRVIDIANLSVRDVPGLDENGLTHCHSFCRAMLCVRYYANKPMTVLREANVLLF